MPTSRFSEVFRRNTSGWKPNPSIKLLVLAFTCHPYYCARHGRCKQAALLTLARRWFTKNKSWLDFTACSISLHPLWAPGMFSAGLLCTTPRRKLLPSFSVPTTQYFSALTLLESGFPRPDSALPTVCKISLHPCGPLSAYTQNCSAHTERSSQLVTTRQLGCLVTRPSSH